MKFSASLFHSNTDEWYTPRENVEIIVPFLKKKKYKHILCPFDTEDSQFTKVLTNEGFNVTYSHIWTGVDFFTLDLKMYDAIVSNPPFSKREPILEKLFASEKPFALILNMNGLFDSNKRWSLFKNNKFELIVPRGRMLYFNSSNQYSSPNFQSCYVCHDMTDKQIEFVEIGQSARQQTLWDISDQKQKTLF